MNEYKSNVVVKVGSERGFGFVFAFVFLVIGLWPLLGGGSIRIWAILIAVGFVALALIAPKVLGPANRLWFKFGMLLGSIIAPIVMAAVFVSTFLTIGLILRLLGKDPLDRKLEPGKTSYWKNRDRSASGSMKNQF